ncbi:MAG: NAD(+) synthase [Eubacterium sp.]|nr:NAD(+) synthase [Eubacterium sp.]
MKDGFIKVAAVTPNIIVADVGHNEDAIYDSLMEAVGAGAKVVVFPELCITGYTCGDLFLQDSLIDGAKGALLSLAQRTEGLDVIFFVGLPVAVRGKLFNCAAAVSGGKILGLVPKVEIPNYSEFYEARYFCSGEITREREFGIDDLGCNMAMSQLFTCSFMPELVIGVEICEDLWSPAPPSIRAAMSGATLIVNLSASDEVTGKASYRRDLVTGQSGRLVCGYVYADAGDGESTQDVVYGAHNIIAENGVCLAESRRFENGMVVSEIDLKKILAERRRISTFGTLESAVAGGQFTLQETETGITRFVDPAPFVPSNEAERTQRCEEIMTIQAAGLKKRLVHTHAKSAVVGISGGLDSTLALLITVRAFDMCGLPRSGITAVTMPGFGTTDRTYDNACLLVKSLGATLMEVSIAPAVRQHFSDIGHDESVHDVTYENSQARERTQILMDLANKTGGLVIGTGDLSELALGWATYNGDHMSMYGVNSSVPKTLVRHLVKYFADNVDKFPENGGAKGDGAAGVMSTNGAPGNAGVMSTGDAATAENLRTVLLDILDTPVSPELLPPTDGQISQKTEDLVGPYELHDFFLYHMMRFGSRPSKIYRLALIAFGKTYDEETVLKWLKTFYRRFFAQQFKRSCLPDGPKVGSVALSPRGDWRMPSDASANIWLKEIEEL